MPTNKVVICRSHSGFGLSAAAVRRIRELSGQPLWGDIVLVGEPWPAPEYEGDTRFGGIPGTIAVNDEVNVSFSTSPLYMPYGIERHDPALVQAVEELGADAGPSLYVREFYGREYRINEYDGLESLERPVDVKWTIVDHSEPMYILALHWKHNKHISILKVDGWVAWQMACQAAHEGQSVAIAPLVSASPAEYLQFPSGIH